MSPLRLILDSLRHHWRMHLAVALGVIAGTAVLTGALVVGDSMQASLRRLVVDRLGNIDSVLVAPRFFRRELADLVAAEPGFADSFEAAQPAILLSGTVEAPESGRRAAGVDLIGCDERFWQLDLARTYPHPGPDEVVLNESLASELQVGVGDEVIVRLPRLDAVPADSPLGRKTETVRNRRYKVAGVMPIEGLGQFGLRPSQRWPKNAYLSIDTLAAALEQPDRANAILVSSSSVTRPAGAEAERWLADQLHPSLADYGVEIERTPQGYFNLTSERMLLEPALVDAVHAAVGEERVQPAFTYLANSLDRADRSIPYSTIAAIDPVADPPLGPFLTTDGKPITAIAADAILLNTWAAEDLDAKPGDEIAVTYFEPESTHGEVVERTEKFKLAAVVQLEGAARDPNFTPHLAGVTDADSMDDWDPPFPFDAARIRSDDEQYWDDFRGTPKAFVSLATGQRLWGSRFGDTTTLRIAPAAAVETEEAAQVEIAALAASIRPDPADMGMQFQPVKRLGLEAAAGTTPFGLLFLGFSLFIIAAAGMLIALLFRLGVETRAAELGLLTAVAIRWRRVRMILALEGLSLAAIAAVAGVAVGIGYAWLMLVGLRTWWLAAVSTPFIELDWSPSSLAIGYFAGVVLAAVGMHWAVARLGRLSTRQLLAGQLTDERSLARPASRWPKYVAFAALVAAVGLAIAAARMMDEARAGAFFGSGALVLVALLTLLRWRLSAGSTRALVTVGRGGLARLAVRNAGRHPGRTTLTVGLVATAGFLIVAIGAFRLDPPGESDDRDTGTGGFALVAESDQPIYENINEALREQATGDEELSLADVHAYALRRRAGDDASCLNLYQPTQPEVLGVPKSLVDRGGFAWAASAATTPEEQQNPWRLLERDLGKAEDGSPIVPVVIDQNTAMYSLHLYGGVGATYPIEDEFGNSVTLEVVGLLKNSILQGVLLIGESQFQRLFPDVSGYRYFLVDAPAAETETVERQLERAWGDYGFDAQRPATRLAAFFAVQNTYLATFQSLGGLGLLLGTFGLATVELRNVLERRGELALLRAVGFRRRSLAELVLLENTALLALGLAIGVIAALVAIAPHLLGGSAAFPIGALSGALGLVLAAGLLAGLAAVRAVLRAPLVPALRGD